MKEKLQLLLSINGQPYLMNAEYTRKPTFQELLDQIPVYVIESPDDPRIDDYLNNRHFARAVDLHGAGRNQRAYKQLIQAFADDNNNCFAFHLLSILFRDCGQLDKALSLINKAITIMGDYVWPSMYIDRARIYMYMGIDELWLPDLQRAKEQDPSYPDTYFELAHYYTVHQEYDQAIKMLDIYLKIEPECPFGWITKGYNELALDHYPKALKCADNALKYDEYSSSPHLLKADIYEKMGKTSLAEGIRAVWGSEP